MSLTQTDALNLVRIAICAAILLYSCITDWRTRRAPNELWEIMICAGIVLLLFEVFTSSGDQRYYILLSFALSYGVIYLLTTFIYYFINRVIKGAFGGADANALAALAVLFPYYPTTGLFGLSLPLVDYPLSPIFTLAAFGNALILNFALPVTILAYNLASVPLREIGSNKFAAIIGYKMKISDLKGKHVRLMHWYEEEHGKVGRRLAPFKYQELDDKLYENLVAWEKAGKIDGKVWITPKIPFLIPITLGVFTALIYGDLMMQIMSVLLVR